MLNYERIPSIISRGMRVLVNGEEYIGTDDGWKPVAKPVPVKKEEKTDEFMAEVIPEEKPVEKKKTSRKKKA